MKNIPLKILILVLIAGILGAAGVVLLTVEMTTLSDSYRTITEDYSLNLKATGDIRACIYKHQALVAKHVVSDTEDKYDEYEMEAAEIEKLLQTGFDDLGERMTGGEREQIFHKAYTGFYSYLENAKFAFSFSRQNQKAMAQYYLVNVMDNNSRTVSAAFDDLDNFSEREIAKAQADLDGYLHVTIVSACICVPVIVVSVIITALFCFKITSDLDKYKNDLERDIEQKNASLREHDEKMLSLQNNVVIAMANLIESRDGDTGEHVKRTERFVNMLACAAQKEGYKPEILTDEYVELLSKAAPLHDIGKIAISDTILMKPGKLTPEEFEIMKTHASEGGKIVRDVMGEIEDQAYVDIAADVAAYHHEKWNGSGYNSGLSGENIPLSARIMAIADVFDALISKRCYKEEFSLDEAFRIIEESAGSHFDPALVKIFLNLRPKIEDYLKTAK